MRLLYTIPEVCITWIAEKYVATFCLMITYGDRIDSPSDV